MCKFATIWEFQLVRQFYILFISKHAIFSEVATCKWKRNGKDILQRVFGNFEQEPSYRNHTGKSLCSLFFKKRTFLQEIQRNSLLTIAVLQPTCCNATKQTTVFILVLLKILENSLDNVCCRIPLCISRHQQILYRITALRLFGKLLGRPTSVLNIDSTTDFLLASF